jgi:hypothetical protein
VINVGTGVVGVSFRPQLSGWPAAVLLTTLYPTGDPDVRAYSHPAPAVSTFGGELSASLRDGDPATYQWFKTVNTGGYGSSAIRRVNWVFDTCPEYAHISHLIARLSSKMILSGGTSKTYFGVEIDDSIPGDPMSILPTNGADWAWQEYLFATNNGAGWTTAGVNARKFGTDQDQYLSSGNPANNIEYRVAEYGLQVWGTA